MIENQLAVANLPQFYGLKIIKKKVLTKNSFAIELEIPNSEKQQFQFQSGQYLTLKYIAKNREVQNDYSITSAPFENRLTLAIKTTGADSNTQELLNNYKEGDVISASLPNGRFYFPIRPNEKRTIIGFAAGIGITPVLSHLKNILENEKSSRFYLFYSNKTKEDVIFYDVLEALKLKYPNRLNIYYFFTQEKVKDLLLHGRIDAKKINLIINQILHLDEDDEESTIWDSTDKIIICGPGEMIKSIANACYENGIPKKNIHFELFHSFNDDIYPPEKSFPLIENITVSYKLNNLKHENIVLKNNERKILQQLLDLGYNVPYSCKSGVCGSCICKLKEGNVEMEESEYLTDNEVRIGKILPCLSIATSKSIVLDFDNF